MSRVIDEAMARHRERMRTAPFHVHVVRKYSGNHYYEDDWETAKRRAVDGLNIPPSVDEAIEIRIERRGKRPERSQAA